MGLSLSKCLSFDMLLDLEHLIFLAFFINFNLIFYAINLFALDSQNILQMYYNLQDKDYRYSYRLQYFLQAQQVGGDYICFIFIILRFQLRSCSFLDLDSYCFNISKYRIMQFFSRQISFCFIFQAISSANYIYQEKVSLISQKVFGHHQCKFFDWNTLVGRHFWVPIIQQCQIYLNIMIDCTCRTWRTSCFNLIIKIMTLFGWRFFHFLCFTEFLIFPYNIEVPIFSG